MERKIVSLSRQTAETSSIPVFVRFFFQERNVLSYKDGAVPFFLKVFEGSNNPSIAEISTNLAAGRRVPKGFIFDKFKVYEVGDYGAQSLSPNYEDFTPLCFTEQGYKIPQKDVVLVRGYTSKKTFILIPKVVYGGEVYNDVTVVMLQDRPVQQSQGRQQLSSSGGGVFSGQLSSLRVDSFDDLAVYAREGSTDFEITNSEDFLSLTRSDMSGNNTIVPEQSGYFEKLQRSQTQAKTGLAVNSSIDIGINGSSAYAGTKLFGRAYYYGTVESVNLSSSQDISSRGAQEVYLELTAGDGSGLMRKLISGRDFFIDSTGKLNVLGSTSSQSKVEVFVRRGRSRTISSSFATGSSYSSGNYTLEGALYHSYIADWYINRNSSRIRIYENGRLVKAHNAESIYSEYGFSASKEYEYLVEDYILKAAVPSAPSAPTNVTFIHDGTSGNTSLAFNKYQIAGDRHLATDGTSISEPRESQDLFLYDSSDIFLRDSKEPFATLSGGSITIQDVVDPYPALLETVDGNYEDFQSEFSGGKTKLTKTLHDSEQVQSIEAQISQLKKNFGAILENSEFSPASYSGSVVEAGQFLFLALFGEAGSTFDLTYKDQSGNIIKREHNCTLDSSGRYISVPFFFDTFGGEETGNTEADIRFEISGEADQYYIFR